MYFLYDFQPQCVGPMRGEELARGPRFRCGPDPRPGPQDLMWEDWRSTNRGARFEFMVDQCLTIFQSLSKHRCA